MPFLQLGTTFSGQPLLVTLPVVIAREVAKITTNTKALIVRWIPMPMRE